MIIVIFPFLYAAPPSISITPEGPITTQLNQTIIVVCTTDSIRDVQFEWLINGEAVVESNISHSITRPNASASALTIANISEAGLGVYTCTIDDGFYDPVDESITIMETDELYFVGGETTVRIHATNGSRLALVCSVRGGVGRPIIRWVNGSSTLHSGLDRVTVNRRSPSDLELIIDPILPGDARQYGCIAIDGFTFITLNFQVDIAGKLYQCHAGTHNLV